MRREENALLTRIGPGTPAGDLMRRYWHPVAAAAELTAEKPIKAVKILDVELVVYRDKSGRYGMVGEHCPHRLVFMVLFTPDEKTRATTDNTSFEYVSMRHEIGKYRMDMVLAQDVMAWETQGKIVDRTQEYLGAADRGIVIFRRLLRQQIDAVKEGRLPLGVKPADAGEKVIELDVINERIGLARSQTEVAARSPVDRCNKAKDA